MNKHFVPLLALLAWTTLWISVDSSSSLTYCSSVNTGTGSANFSIYQSNGNCEDHCSDSAFAILLDKNCWCSDVAPNEDDNVDTSNCDDNCPGYPDDSCGNAVDSLYAYIQLGSPSSTASASSTKSTSSSTSTTSSKVSIWHLCCGLTSY
jgi:cell wall integrity and stress response component